MRHLIPGTEIAWDTETTGTNSWKGAQPFIFSFANGDGQTEVVEFPVSRKTRRVQYGHRPAAFRAVKAILEDNRVSKIGFNWKFDFRMARAAQINVRGWFHDVMVMAKIARSDEIVYGLKPLAKKYGNFDDADEKALKDAIRKLLPRAKRLKWKVPGGVESNYWLASRAAEIMIRSTETLKGTQGMKPEKREALLAKRYEEGKAWENLGQAYAGTDAERTIFLKMFYEERLRENDLWKIYLEEMELMKVVIQMEDYGVQSSPAWVEAGIEMATSNAAELMEKVRNEIGPDFNPRSYPQKVKYFIEKKGLEPIALTKKGNPSIDKDFYEEYAATVPACAWMVLLDRFEKAEDFFWGNKNHADDRGVVHCNFDQIGAKTLRFSCREPNLQNQPKRGRCPHCKKELKFKRLSGFRVQCKECGEWQLLDPLMAVRRPFRPRSGSLWILGDYKQIEARVFADEAGEEVLLRAFAAGRDPYEELNATIVEEAGLNIGRDIAKHIFLGKIYGLGVGKMCRTIREMGGGKMDEDDARSIIDTFDSTFSASTDYMKETQREVKRDGGVRNRYGQWIDVDPEFAYKGVNYKIQSAAARLMKRAMVRVNQFLTQRDEVYSTEWTIRSRLPFQPDGDLGHLLMTIHDELIAEVEDDCDWQEKGSMIKKIMEDNEGVFTVATPVDMALVKKTWLLKEEFTAA